MSGSFTLEAAQKALKRNGLNLRVHQVEGINTILKWYEEGHGGILADEMGLGKTCQSIIAISILMSSTGKTPCLVICPLSVLDHWRNEIDRFSCGMMKCFCYYDSRDKRVGIRKQLLTEDWNVLLTTYDVFLSDYHLLKYTWEFVIFDESQRVKNINAQLTIGLRRCSINWMISMTGTPVQNNLSELYSLLNLADKEKFPLTTVDDFVYKYELFKEEESNKEFREMFEKYSLRRTKTIINDIPPCEEITLYHGMTNLQTQLYKAILAHNRNFFFEQTKNKHNSNQSLNNILMQLRKAVNHPYLFKGFEKEPFVEGEHIRDASGKMLILDRLLKYLYERKHKVLIFSQYVQFLNIIHDYLVCKGYSTEQLDGSVKQIDRQNSIDNFQKNKNVFAFLLSTRAGGIGLNLTAADTVIFVDYDYNPQNDKQAAARCHRIGQNKPVKIIRLMAKHTIDEIIQSRAFRKLVLAKHVMGTEDDVHSKVDILSDLLVNLKKLEEDVDATVATVQAITDYDLEEIIGKSSRSGLWEVKKNINESLATQVREDEDLSTRSLYQYEGHDYHEDRVMLEKIADSLACGIMIGPNGEVQGSVNNEMKSRSTRGRRRVITEAERTEMILEMKRRTEEKKRILIEKKEKLWLQSGYKSMNLPAVEPLKIHEFLPKNGRLYSVQGDVTSPVTFTSNKDTQAVIVHCVSESAFGNSGVSWALRKLNGKIFDAYNRAKEMRDLKFGDCHLISLDANNNSIIANATEDNVKINLTPLGDNSLSANSSSCDMYFNTNTNENLLQLAVGLMVCNKIGNGQRNKPSLSALGLERALCRIGQYAVNNNASIHMSQIWFKQQLKESEVRYIIRKCLCYQFGVDVYIYHYAKNVNVDNVIHKTVNDETDQVLGNLSNIPALKNNAAFVNGATIVVDDSKCTFVPDSKELDLKYNSASSSSADDDSDDLLSGSDDDEVGNNSEENGKKQNAKVKKEEQPSISEVDKQNQTHHVDCSGDSLILPPATRKRTLKAIENNNGSRVKRACVRNKN